MKFYALALAAVAAAVPAVGAAQTQTATINVTAKVQTSVSFSNSAPLDFGAAITPGTAASVSAANGGKVMISYNTPATVTVAGTSLTETAVGGSATIPVTYSCAHATTGTSATPTAFAGTCAAGYVTTLNGRAKTDHWIYLGGDIAGAATTSVPAGNYAGTATFTATYTNY
jgi:hypothetical protein